MTKNSCVVFGCLLDGQGGAQQVDDSLGTGSQPVWIHIDFSSQQAHRWLASQGIEPHVIATLIQEESRPRTLATDKGLLIVLRGINRNAGADPEDMVSVRIWIEPGRMISVRQRKVIAAQEAMESLKKGDGPKDISKLLMRLIERLADGIGVFIDGIEERMENYESAVATGELAELRSAVSTIRRQVAAVRRYLAPQRDALEALHRRAGSLLDANELYLVREQSDRITRYVEDLDLVRERGLVLQEELMNRTSQEQNARTYLLSIVAAIFLPITFISGVFGMNVAGLPGLENINSFWIVSGVMMGISAATLIWLRHNRWF
jgi:zinc transporter